MGEITMELTSGDGYGDGYGYGYGSGDGSGYGSGYGDGYGYGYGSGDTKASTEYFTALLESHTCERNERLCFWNSDADGRPANGGKANGTIAVGVVQTVQGPLQLCGPRALHGTLNPANWKGKRTWIVALKEPVERDDDKLGSLQRRFVADLGLCKFGKE